MKILVALSGGVDSSTIAHLLHEQGHELVGVMMKLWMDPLAPEVRRSIPTKCCSVEHIQRARTVCADLAIPFYLVNLEDEFKEYVVDPFLESYAKGATPNPCIACNRHIKFGMLLKKAKELGCDKIATGHYARIQEDSDGRCHLLQAADKEKDQSYYLYGLDQADLQNILFPLGNMLKSDVYELAQKYGISIPETYRESQDLCFFPEKDPSAFLQRYIDNIEPGDIVDESGTVVGKHKGLPFYTIGQRKGLGIGGLQIPLHVQRKDSKTNTIYVAKDGADTDSALYVDDIRWLHEEPTQETVPLGARVSSLGVLHQGVLKKSAQNIKFTFSAPVRGIADDQAIVFYRDDEVLGGGKIRRLDTEKK